MHMGSGEMMGGMQLRWNRTGSHMLFAPIFVQMKFLHQCKLSDFLMLHVVTSPFAGYACCCANATAVVCRSPGPAKGAERRESCKASAGKSPEAAAGQLFCFYFPGIFPPLTAHCLSFLQ